MGYAVAAILVLGLVAYTAVNVAYYAFAAAMSVANAVSGTPMVFLHGRILREVEAGTTLRYEVVRLHDTSPYADRRSNNRIVFEAVNRSRWPITGITPRCTVAFADGDWAYLTVDIRAERTRLDDTGGGEAKVEAAMRGYAQVLGGGAPKADQGDGPAAAPDLDLLACDADIPALAAWLAAPDAPKGWALLVAGPAGSGRSTLAAHLAASPGLPVVRRRGADLTGGASGEAPGALALAFAEARADPRRPVAALPEVFARRLEIVAAAAKLERGRLLRWVLAWTGLSAAWSLGNGTAAAVALRVAELAAAELDR